MAEAVECLLYKCNVLSSFLRPQSTVMPAVIPAMGGTGQSRDSLVSLSS